VVPVGSDLVVADGDLLVVRPGSTVERVVDSTSGAVTACRRTNEVAEALHGRPGGRFEIDGADVVVRGSGADIELWPTGAERAAWSADGGEPGRGGRATVPGYVHDAVLSPDGDLVMVIVDTYLEGVD
jgi:hypothetical protein